MADPVNQYTYSIPPQLEKFATDVLGRSEALSRAPYTLYKGIRIPGLSPLQKFSQEEIAGMQVPAQIGVGSTAANEAMESLLAQYFRPNADYTDMGLRTTKAGTGALMDTSSAVDNNTYRTPFTDIKYMDNQPNFMNTSNDYSKKFSGYSENIMDRILNNLLWE